MFNQKPRSKISGELAKRGEREGGELRYVECWPVQLGSVLLCSKRYPVHCGPTCHLLHTRQLADLPLYSPAFNGMDVLAVLCESHAQLEVELKSFL